MPEVVDENAATEAIRRSAAANRPALLSFVRARANGRIEAEEVVQTAITRALSKSEQVRDVAKVDAWLARIVRNVLLDELRKKKHVVLPVDEMELAAIDTSDDIDCWCVLVQAEQLKPEYSEILRRVLIQGMPVSDAAQEMGLTANNAMVRLHRARNALRTRMAAHCGTTSARSCSDCGCEERGCCSP